MGFVISQMCVDLSNFMQHMAAKLHTILLNPFFKTAAFHPGAGFG